MIFLPYKPIQQLGHKRSSNKTRHRIQYRNQKTLQQSHSKENQTFDRNLALFSRLKHIMNEKYCIGIITTQHNTN